MKAKPIFIAVAAIFSASAIAGGQSQSSSQGASQEPATQQQSQSQSQQNPEIVKQAQEKLSAAGHEVQADGKMGPKTQAAVKEFQQKEGLQASGQLDQQTLAALEIGTPEGTTSSSAGSSSSGASGGSSSAGSSSERTSEPSEPSKSSSEPSKSQ
jgi:peptidoglycan hydrolase-like protein with peptidoglycan-binding domain